MKIHTHTFVIPGTQSSLHYERSESGQLLRLTGNGRTYLHQREFARVLDDDFVTITEILHGNKLRRQVATAEDFWVEEYHWDQHDRVVWVDGVRIERDERNRVTRCITPEGEWRYAYTEDWLVRIESPTEVRHLRRGKKGRVERIRCSLRTYEVPYDRQDHRCDIPDIPATYHRDTLGRLWAITDSAGHVTTTYLWDGYACLGRIDGSLGAPLSAVFSLDPTCTPVRVIARDHVVRISRDAFGEQLLTQENVPGLFGGTVYNGFCYYTARVLDPRSAAYHAPDPLDGRENDPRREAGYHGALMVEHPAAGPYAVCQHDPISRTDPTGEFSVWILLSDLTWSLQNNMVGWLGMDFIFNFWGSLFSGTIGRFFDRGGESSDRIGTGGVRSDGVMGLITGGRAFTFQHQVWSPSKDFDELSDARVLDPQGPFRPTLCGTLLRAVPDGAQPFLLQGDANLTAGAPLVWTRAGGAAEAVVPGSLIPHFPAGGLHFDKIQVGLHGPLSCPLTELDAVGTLSGGTVDNRIIIDIPAQGLGLQGNSLVLLSDVTPSVFIQDIAAAITEGSNTRVYLKTDLPTLGPSNVRLRGLGAAVSTENVSHDATTPAQYLNATGTTGAYNRGDPLQLSQGSTPIGAALIDRFEARLQIDTPIIGLNAPLSVATAQALGASNAATLAADAQTLDSASNPPNINDALVIKKADGSSSLSVIVTARTGNQWRVDRPVQPLLGAVGANVSWQRLTVALAPIGTKEDALEVSAMLTYRADTPRTAPTSNFVHVRDRDGKVGVRAVTGLTYDAIVLSTPLPGNTANPYSVERFPIQAPDQNNLTVTRAQALVLNPPLRADAVALQYYQFPGATMTTGTAISVTPTGGPLADANFIINASSNGAGFILPAGATMTGLNTLRPAQLIGMRPTGGNVIAALVKKIKLTVTLDRLLPLGTNDLQAVRLSPTGPVYNATAHAIPAGSGVAAVITAQPETTVSGPPIHSERLHMPRLQPGELVLVKWTTGGGGVRRYRVGAPASDPVPPVDGATLGVMNDSPLPTPFPADLTVQRLEPTAPTPPTGSSRIALRGTPGAAGGTNRVTFEVWAGDGLPLTTEVGIVDPAANVTFPALVNSIDTVEIEFASLTTVPPGNATLLPATPNVRGAAAAFTRDQGALIISGNALRTGTDLILAVLFKDSTRTTSGSLSGGAVIVPDDSDDGELTRLDSLITHELTHTRQWAMFGPWMLFCFPTFIVEGIVEAATDVELPKFSPYVAGTIVKEGGNRFLQIPDPQGITFSAGLHIQLSWSAQQPGPSGPVTASGAGMPHSLILGAQQQANKFQITAGPNMVPVEVVNVQVRREQGNSGWGTTLNIAHQLSAGGILNQVAGFVYGGLFTLIGRGVYALVRLIGGQGKNYPATVEGSGDEAGKQLHVGDADGRTALGGASRIIIQAADKTLVRNVQRIAGEVIHLTEAVDFTGNVRVAPYETHTPDSYWDWRNYYPATVPNPDRPAAIKVEAVDGDSLTLQLFDRVVIAVGNQSYHRTVTAVAGDGTVELDEAPPLNGEPVFRVAKIGEGDPLGNLDNASLIELYGMGWMRWLFDFYGQLHFRTRPDPGSFWDIVARIARYAFSSESWSFIWASVLTIDRVHQKEHLARIEQEASSESGDTYSPLGRLRGQLSIVGDIARYWQVPIGGTRNTDTMITRSMQDAPGVWLTDVPRIIPSLSLTAGATVDPNGTAGVSATVADPGRDIPDVFFATTTSASNNPLTAKATSPGGFQPALRGWIPASPILQRSSGIYTAFSRSGTHRVTIKNGVTGAQEAREAQEASRQTLWFDVNVQPVVVSVNGQTTNEGDTIRLVLRQQATVSASANGARRYAATVLRQTQGEVLRVPDVNNPLVIAAQDQVGTEAVELSRFYHFDPATRTYDDTILQRHGVHIPTDIHIPVRSFTIEVVNTLPVRNALSLDVAAEITTLSPNQDAFILVPVAIGPQALQIVTATITATGVALSDAERTALRGNLVQSPPASLPDNIRAFVRDGGVIQLRYVPAITLPSQTVLQMTVEVGAAVPRTTLNMTLNLVP